MSINGRDLSQAWMEWQKSTDGVKCEHGTAEGQYLSNRLWRAFMAGAKAAEKITELAAQPTGKGDS